MKTKGKSRFSAAHSNLTTLQTNTNAAQVVQSITLAQKLKRSSAAPTNHNNIRCIRTPISEFVVHCTLQIAQNMLDSLPVRESRIGVEFGKNSGSIGDVWPGILLGLLPPPSLSDDGFPCHCYSQALPSRLLSSQQEAEVDPPFSSYPRRRLPSPLGGRGGRRPLYF
jgi:hypothetical protein